MKWFKFNLRDLFWLTLVLALASFSLKLYWENHKVRSDLQVINDNLVRLFYAHEQLKAVNTVAAAPTPVNLAPAPANPLGAAPIGSTTSP